MMIPVVPSTPTPPTTIRLDDHKATIKLSKHHEHSSVLKHIHVKVNDPQGKQIASLGALQIKRAPCREYGDFLRVLDEDEQELADFSLKLFDKYGDIRPWHVDDEKLKGTGCWGRELNQGILYYVFFVDIPDESMRGQGLGSWTLQQLLGSDIIKEEDFVIAWPSPLPSRKERSKRQWKEEMDNVTAFFQKNNFRRIGLTQFLAYSPKTDHLSRNIPLSADAEFLSSKGIQSKQTEDDEDIIDSSFEGFSQRQTKEAAKLAEHIKQFPLHHRISEQKDDSIEQTIHAAFAEDQRSVRMKDNNGFTPLYVAAGAHNVSAIRTLLELGAQEDVLDRENADMTNAVMACESKLRGARDFADTFLRSWDGYSEDGLRVEAMLKRAIGQDVGTDEQYVQAKKWGCTCGRCAGGWLSPQLVYRLAGHADWIFDSMQVETEMLFPVNGVPADIIYIEMNLVLPYLPLHMHSRIYKTFHAGFRFVFGAISQVLTELGKEAQTHGPTTVTANQIHTRIVKKLSGELPWSYHAHPTFYERKSVEFFFAKGGKIEHALDALTHSLPNEFEMWGGFIPEIDAELEREYSQFPVCANDREMMLVRHNLGLVPGKMWGPYGSARELFGDGGLGGLFGEEEDDDEEDEEGISGDEDEESWNEDEDEEMDDDGE